MPARSFLRLAAATGKAARQKSRQRDETPGHHRCRHAFLTFSSKLTDQPVAVWLLKLLVSEQVPDWTLFAGQSVTRELKGTIICSCHEIGETQIADAILKGADTVDKLGKQLRCGTHSGSCIPELHALLSQAVSDADTESHTLGTPA